jgi:hypothetical protein
LGSFSSISLILLRLFHILDIKSSTYYHLALFVEEHLKNAYHMIYLSSFNFFSRMKWKVVQKNHYIDMILIDWMSDLKDFGCYKFSEIISHWEVQIIYHCNFK